MKLAFDSSSGRVFAAAAVEALRIFASVSKYQRDPTSCLGAGGARRGMLWYVDAVALGMGQAMATPVSRRRRRMRRSLGSAAAKSRRCRADIPRTRTQCQFRDAFEAYDLYLFQINRHKF